MLGRATPESPSVTESKTQSGCCLSGNLATNRIFPVPTKMEPPQAGTWSPLSCQEVTLGALETVVKFPAGEAARCMRFIRRVTGQRLQPPVLTYLSHR